MKILAKFFAETSAKRLSTYGAQESGRADYFYKQSRTMMMKDGIKTQVAVEQEQVMK